MNLKKLEIIASFFLKPKYTLLKSDASDYSFVLAGLLLLAACFSVEVSGLIADKEFKTLSTIISSAVSSAALLTIELLLVEAMIVFAASMPRRNIQGSKILFFSLISCTPGILYTPLAIICNALGDAGTMINLIVSLAITFYIFYLIILSIRTTLNISRWRLALLMVYPALITIVFVLAAATKVASL